MGFLTKQDKKELLDGMRIIVQEELKALVMRDIIMEKGPRKQGDPEGHVQKEMTVNVIDMCAEYLCRSEGAMRGLQADVDRTVNSVDDMSSKIEGMGEALISFGAPVTKLAHLQATLGQELVLLPSAKPKAIGE